MQQQQRSTSEKHTQWLWRDHKLAVVLLKTVDESSGLSSM
jgi:hypothetical protein